MQRFVPFVAGVALALAAGLGARAAGLDRDRAFYPVVMIAIALLYGLFAAIDGSLRVAAIEVACMVPFVAAALLGFKRSLWLVAGALACHGLFDLLHSHVVVNRGVPPWWPAFCGAYDVTAALYLARLLRPQNGNRPTA